MKLILTKYPLAGLLLNRIVIYREISVVLDSKRERCAVLRRRDGLHLETRALACALIQQYVITSCAFTVAVRL